MKKKTLDYSKLSEHYDEIMGNAYLDTYLEILSEKIGTDFKNKKIVDFGCGTGTLLSRFSKLNKTFGVDLSFEMIEIAKEKDSNSVYSVGNIVDVNVGKDFDVALCTFDTVNHLLDANDWVKFFENVSLHLKKGGIFLFDFNTLEKFNEINGKELISDVNDDLQIVMKTETKINLCTWDIKYIENKKNIKTEIIKEVSFDIDVVTNYLDKIFIEVKILSEHSDKKRVFVFCRK